jgi:two-component system cell cycle response regulator CpdR
MRRASCSAAQSGEKILAVVFNSGPTHFIRAAVPATGRGERAMAAILLAEDDDSMRRFLKKALEKAGHSVVDAAQGDEALTELQLREFDLLLTDIVMPVMDGIELARQAAEIDPDMKIMFITGFAAVALNPANRAPQDAKVLSKPFHLKDLVQEIDRVIAA